MYAVAKYSDEDWSRLGRAIEERRTDKGMTQEQLAEEAGVAPNTIGNREAGKRGRMLELPDIARALGWTSNSCRLILEGMPPVEDEVDTKPNDALLLKRPDDIDDEAWAELREIVAADFERYLRWRRKP